MEDVLKNGSNTEQTISEGAETSSKSYTEAELTELLQKETDKRVSSALKKQQYSFDKKIAEADKLSKMDQDQKKVYEYESKVKELEDNKKEFNLMRNKMEASKILSSRNLPIDFVDYIVAEDAETMLEKINQFESAFKSAVNDAVSRKIASPSPKSGSSVQTGLNKESFIKMTIAERSNLFNTNPTLYKELSK